jgi:hypothetical protein
MWVESTWSASLLKSGCFIPSETRNWNVIWVIFSSYRHSCAQTFSHTVTIPHAISKNYEGDGGFQMAWFMLAIHFDHIENTLPRRYKDYLLHVVWGSEDCLLWESYEIHKKWTMCAQNAEFCMLMRVKICTRLGGFVQNLNCVRSLSTLLLIHKCKKWMYLIQQKFMKVCVRLGRGRVLRWPHL